MSILSRLMMVLVCLWLAGCAVVHPSTIQSRKQERYAAYSALSPEFQAAVDEGKLKAGMNSDAVFIAWGKPDQIVNSGNQSGEAVTWLYQHTYLQETTYFGTYRTHYAETPVTYNRAEVVFTGGVVKEWKQNPKP